MPDQKHMQAQKLQSLKPLDLAEINREFRIIAAENSWQAYHTPKNLASAVAVEASELLAEFQWLGDKESACLNTEKTSRVADEMADIVMYLTELSMQLNIDLADALQAKIEKNKLRFKKPI